MCISLLFVDVTIDTNNTQVYVCSWWINYYRINHVEKYSWSLLLKKEMTKVELDIEDCICHDSMPIDFIEPFQIFISSILTN